jgi:hypothetical protein
MGFQPIRKTLGILWFGRESGLGCTCFRFYPHSVTKILNFYPYSVTFSAGLLWLTGLQYPRNTSLPLHSQHPQATHTSVWENIEPDMGKNLIPYAAFKLVDGVGL